MNVKAGWLGVASRADPVRPRVGTACPRWRPAGSNRSPRLGAFARRAYKTGDGLADVETQGRMAGSMLERENARGGKLGESWELASDRSHPDQRARRCGLRGGDADVTMGRDRKGGTPLALALLAVTLLARPAGAALGDSLASIEDDQLHMKGTLQTVAMPGYLLHEIQTPTGTVVREFSSSAGTIFGVSWQGPFLPDLHHLLGASYDAYTQAARKKPLGRGPLLLHLPELVFESTGHPRSFHGRAYIPGLVPEGVPADGIR
jgi:hypothetical protein